MSTSLLYHGFGLVGYRHQSLSFESGALIFKVTPDERRLVCPGCNGKNITLEGVVPRRFQTVPLGWMPAYIDLDVQRVRCHTCARTRQVDIGFADPHKRYTKRFERMVVDLCRRMTMQDVSNFLGLSWDTVKAICKANLLKRFASPCLKHLKRIAIDEVYLGKRHKFITVVLDLDSGAVVHIAPGKSAESLTGFFKDLSRSGAKVQAVATDMGAAFLLAIKCHLPDAIHVLDHFHVSKLFNDHLSQLRREVQASHEKTETSKLLKGTRWLLVKNPENLKNKDERTKLQDALKINQPLATAYYMKDEFRQFWNQWSKAGAERFLNGWIERAHASGVAMLKKMANTLQLHKTSLLAWYDAPISTGPLEATNNKIKTLQRKAYGYRDYEFFKLKIYASHEATYALVG